MFSPPTFNLRKDISIKQMHNFIESSAKSSEGTSNSFYNNKTNDNINNSYYIRRKYSKIEKYQGSKVEWEIDYSSPVKSSDSKGSESDSIPLNNRNNNNQKMKMPMQRRNLQVNPKFQIKHPCFRSKNPEHPKTSFEVNLNVQINK